MKQSPKSRRVREPWSLDSRREIHARGFSSYIRSKVTAMLNSMNHPPVVLRFKLHGERHDCCRRYCVERTVRSNHQVRRIRCSRITSAVSTSSVMDFSKLGVAAMSLTCGLSFLGAIGIGLSVAFQPTWLVRWLQKVHRDVFFLKPTEAKVIALTIDDAPHPDVTPQILDLLQEYDFKATFFVIGENMDRWPGLVERMHAEGHEVGNHTMQDVASWRLSPNEFLHQLMQVDDRITKYFVRDITWRPIKWFRPGHGLYTSWMLAISKAQGYKLALGSLYPHDTLFTAQAMVLSEYLLWRMHAGAIVVLHDRQPQRDQTLKVLQRILPELKSRGYDVVTLSELHLLPGSKD